MLAISLADAGTQVTLKSRSGGAVDEDEDMALPYWAGVIPIQTVEGPPEPDAALVEGAVQPVR